MTFEQIFVIRDEILRVIDSRNLKGDLTREIASQEMEMARLRSPQAIREQAERLGLDVGPRESAPAAPVKRTTRSPRRNGN